MPEISVEVPLLEFYEEVEFPAVSVREGTEG
jgi:hypothetical protein